MGMLDKPSVERPVVNDKAAEVERPNAPSSSSAIPPPTSPPPQLDPEDRRRKIAALKVRHLPGTVFTSHSRHYYLSVMAGEHSWL